MALYHHAPTREGAAETISIVSSDQGDGYTLYVILVNVPPYKWMVRHRYSKFYELHEKLVTNYNIKKSLLPPKKLFGKQSESFIQQRQSDLEQYLHTIFQLFNEIPPPLAEFLDFPHYEVINITEVLAEKLFFQGDQLLASEGVFEMSPLELNALNTRLSLPEPTCASGDKKKDVGHVLDFISQLQHLCIKGSNQPVGTSDIIPNLLSFDLTFFRSLQTLQIEECTITGQLKGLENVRHSAKTLMIHKSLTELRQFLLCDDIHWSPTNGSESLWPTWTLVSHVDLSHNSLQQIDPAIRLLSTVEFLDLSHNLIRVIENLETLPRLSVLNLAHNQISQVESLHTKLGNVHTLCLSANSISSLAGFSRLYSLVQLDLSSNQIEQVGEVSYLKSLPCLELLTLTHNPVTTVVDYRANILLAFDTRSSELTLDGKKPSQKELDTVAILRALQLAREGRVWQHSKESTSFSSIVSQTTYAKDSLGVNTALEATEETVQRCEEDDVTDASASTLVEKLQLENEEKAESLIAKDEPSSSAPSAMSKTSDNRDTPASEETQKTDEAVVAPAEAPVNDTEESSAAAAEKPTPNVERKLSEGDASTVPQVNHGRKLPIKGGEMMIPETLQAVDVGNPHFRANLQSVLIKAAKNSKNQKHEQEHAMFYRHSHEGNTLWWSAWGVTIFGQTLAWQRIPTCIAFCTCCIQVLHLTGIRQQMEPLMLQPDMIPAMVINPAMVTSVCIGPRKTYIELSIGSASSGSISGSSSRSLTCVFLVSSAAMADAFVSKILSVYGMVAKPKYMDKQFESLLLQDLNGMPGSKDDEDARKGGRVLFCERILVSRSHRICGGGNSINYLVITPSRLMIIEEVLLLPQVFGHGGSCGSPFKVNMIACVKDEIMNMHVHDRNNLFNLPNPAQGAEDSEAQVAVCDKESQSSIEAMFAKEVEDVQKCCSLSELHLTGYWMYIKFQGSASSRCQFHVRFLTRQVRSNFLEAFLKARSE